MLQCCNARESGRPGEEMGDTRRCPCQLPAANPSESERGADNGGIRLHQTGRPSRDDAGGRGRQASGEGGYQRLMQTLSRVTPPSQCRVHLATNVISMSSRFRRNRKGAGRPHKRCVGLVCEASAVAKSAARTEMHAARLVRSHPQRRWGAHATRWRAKNCRQNLERGSTPRDCPDAISQSVHLSPQVRGIPRLTSSSPKRNSASLASTVCGWTSSTTCTFLKRWLVGACIYHPVIGTRLVQNVPVPEPTPRSSHLVPLYTVGARIERRW